MLVWTNILADLYIAFNDNCLRPPGSQKDPETHSKLKDMPGYKRI